MAINPSPSLSAEGQKRRQGKRRQGIRRTPPSAQAIRPGLLGKATALLVLSSSLAWAAEQANVLFIAIDDLVPTLGCYGDPIALTPEIDALAAQGTTFLNHYCQWAVCGPSRAALSTSLMPEETKVMGFKPIRAVLPEVITMPQHFRNNGYETACTGKFHDFRTVGEITDPNGPTSGGANTDDLPSWSIPYVKAASGFNPVGKPATDDSDLPSADYTDHKILTEGLNLIDTLADGTKPFFLAVGFKKPHLAFIAPKDSWDLYVRDDFPLASFTTAPADASTFMINVLANNSEILGYEPFDTTGLPTPAEQRKLIHGYYACVSFVDSLVGQLLDKLAATDDPLQAGKKMSETTIVVLWGDHGFHLGDHNKWAKHSNLDRGTACPLIIHDPTNPGGGAKTTSPVNSMDLYPTLCELAALPVPEQPLSDVVTTGRPLRGRSLVPLLNDPTASVNHGAISQFSKNGSYGYAYRTERFRYIEWINGSNNVTARELYDYQNDPLETRNIVDDPAYAAIGYQLSRSMRAETTTQGAERLQNSPATTSGAEATLPDLEIAPVAPDDCKLSWPGSGGVTYDVLSNPDLLPEAWSVFLANVADDQAVFPAILRRNFFLIGIGDNTPPVFTSDPIVKTAASIDQDYIGSLTGNARDADSGDVLSFSKIDGPSWLSVAGNGELSGTPVHADLGASYITVEVSDHHGASTRALLQISVGDPSRGTTSTFFASDDTFGKQAKPTNTFGSNKFIELRQNGGSNFARVGYLKFAVSGVGSVQSATLYLHSNDEADPVNVLAVADSSWTEGSLTWDKRPPSGTVIGGAVATPGAWFAIDLSSYITGDGSYAIALDEQGNSFHKLDSNNGGFTPYLEVVWK